jgi:hypothetical protein
MAMTMDDCLRRVISWGKAERERFMKRVEEAVAPKGAAAKKALVTYSPKTATARKRKSAATARRGSAAAAAKRKRTRMTCSGGSCRLVADDDDDESDPDVSDYEDDEDMEDISDPDVSDDDDIDDIDDEPVTRGARRNYFGLGQMLPCGHRIRKHELNEDITDGVFCVTCEKFFHVTRAGDILPHYGRRK